MKVRPGQRKGLDLDRTLYLILIFSISLNKQINFKLHKQNNKIIPQYFHPCVKLKIMTGDNFWSGPGEFLSS